MEASGTLGLFIMVRAGDGRNDGEGAGNGVRLALRVRGESFILEDSFAPKMRGVSLRRRSGER